MNSSNPLFSVVIPTFNRASTLSNCIMSVQNQMLSDWELLIVDDGSIDNSFEIISDFMQSDDRISYYQRPNERQKGANAARNYGIELSKGEYIALLDSDDEWLPQKLQDDYDFLRSHPQSRGIYSGIIIETDKKKTFSKTRAVMPGESYVDFIFEPNMIAQTGTYVLKRQYALKVKFDENLQRHQDLDYFIRFGKTFGWAFNNCYNIIVHWEINRKSKPHFPSMITYYERYKDEITDKSSVGKYLVNCWVNAKVNEPAYCKTYRGFMMEIFMSLSFKLKVFSLAPHLFFYAWNKFLNKDGHWGL